MRNFFAIILMLFTFGAQAQTCSTHKAKNGAITKYARVQFGKDTILLNTPFHPKDKPGMSIGITLGTNIFFSFDLRSIDPALLKDSINMLDGQLQLVMKDKDTVSITPLKKFISPQGGKLLSPGAVSVYLSCYLTNDQLLALDKSKIACVIFYPNRKSAYQLPVTRHESNEFKTAMDYLLNK